MPESPVLKASTKEVPFFGNPDGVSCAQAVYKMILEYFEPSKDYSFEEMNRLCGATPGKYTWLFSIVSQLADKGYDVRVITDYDFESMATDLRTYWERELGPEATADYLKNSDMAALPEQIHQFMRYVRSGKLTFEKRHWVTQDLIDALAQGYLAGTWVNYHAIHDQDGFTGHFVLCFDFDGENFILHDPGGQDKKTHLSSLPISPEKFVAAASPKRDGKTDDLILIKPKKDGLKS